ncbi:MAG: MATE family efflux transporter [Cellvibrionaceae bacterium]
MPFSAQDHLHNKSQDSPTIRYGKIWALTWPVMLSGLSTPLLGAIDTAILGHLENARYLSAVAVGSSLLSIVFWLFAFLRMGATSLSARAYGANESQNIKRVLQVSLLMAFSVAFLLLALSPLYIPLGIFLMQPSESVQLLAAEYCEIRILSAPAALANYAIAGWLIGQQRPRAILILLLFTNSTNVLLDFWFIQGLGLNSKGAAWASVCAEYSGFLLGLLLCKFRWKALTAALSTTANEQLLTFKQSFSALLNVNKYLFIRSAALLLAFTFFTAQGARMGDDIVAANAILLNLLLLVSFGLDGFAHAAEALVGSAMGAKNRALFYSACRRTFILAFALALAYSLSIALLKTPIIYLYTDNLIIKNLLAEYWWWLVIIPVIGVSAFHLDGIYVGAGDGKTMAIIMLISVLAVYLPLWWLTSHWQNHGLWLCLCALFISRGILQGADFVRKSQKESWLKSKT